MSEEEIRRICERINNIDIERDGLVGRLNELNAAAGITLSTQRRSPNHPRARRTAQSTRTFRSSIQGDNIEYKYDSNGNQLTEGDRVHFLTKGVYRSRYGTITSLGTKRATCINDEGNTTNRAYKNLVLAPNVVEHEQ